MSLGEIQRKINDLYDELDEIDCNPEDYETVENTRACLEVLVEAIDSGLTEDLLHAMSQVVEI